jgi:hypothetical protein
MGKDPGGEGRDHLVKLAIQAAIGSRRRKAIRWALSGEQIGELDGSGNFLSSTGKSS